MKDYGTKHVEMAWITPFRKYVPAILVLCIALLLTVTVAWPMRHLPEAYQGWPTALLLVFMYAALAALALYLFVSARTIEESQQTEIATAQEIYELNERLNTTLRSIGDGVISTDVDGVINLMNGVAVSLTGCLQAKAMKRPIEQVMTLLNEQTLAPEPSPVRRVLQLGKPVRQEDGVMLLAQNGSRRPISYHAAPVLDADGWMMGSVIVFHDIQAFREIRRQREVLIQDLSAANEKLRSSNAALEEYARVASHDLQEPLRKIESFSQVLIEDYGANLNDEARSYLDIVTDAARRMRRLIRDVLAFSRAGTSEQPLAAVNLNQVMEVVKDNLSERIQEKGAGVTVQSLPKVYADETQMVQVFQNLVGNGLKFNDKPRPTVEVFAEEQPIEWKIFVKDNGIGMSESESHNIFAPFKRLHSRDEYEGTGIGLAICRRIVTRHGGSIGVESAPNVGSTFWLTLPKVEHPPQEKLDHEAKDPETKRREIHEPRHH